MLVSESNEIEAYRHIMRDSVLTDNSDALHMVRKVGERIARAANKPEYRWEFRVIDNSEDISAFCVPGGEGGGLYRYFPYRQR
jgi:metalloendopeptidase OMA1, mitochondrial